MPQDKSIEQLLPEGVARVSSQSLRFRCFTRLHCHHVIDAYVLQVLQQGNCCDELNLCTALTRGDCPAAISDNFPLKASRAGPLPIDCPQV